MNETIKTEVDEASQNQVKKGEINMCLAKCKWEELEKKVADLEEQIQSQQQTIKKCKDMLISLGINRMCFDDSSSQQQYEIHPQQFQQY